MSGRNGLHTLLSNVNIGLSTEGGECHSDMLEVVVVWLVPVIRKTIPAAHLWVEGIAHLRVARYQLRRGSIDDPLAVCQCLAERWLPSDRFQPLRAFKST